MASTRLPGKAMMLLAGYPVLWHVYQRVKAAGFPTVVATDGNSGAILELCRRSHIPCHIGADTDLLDRFYTTALVEKADPIIRVTADCPLIDAEVLQRLVAFAADGGFDYASVCTSIPYFINKRVKMLYPDGLDAEVITLPTLRRAWVEALKPADREHVGPYIAAHPEVFHVGHLKAPVECQGFRWTLDTHEDYLRLAAIYEALYRGQPFSFQDVMKHLGEQRMVV